MSDVLRRPDAILRPGSGLFRNDHFQIAYATNDIDRACELFSQRYGVTEFRRLEGPTAEGGYVRVELGWAGGIMYELAFGRGPGAEVFSAGLPADEFALRLHHFGYYVPTAAAWDAVRQEIDQGGYKVVRWTNAPGFLQACIVDVPELGHYLEYIFPEDGGRQFFEGAPSN